MTDNAHLDRVAEAISDTIPGRPDWSTMAESGRNSYRRMAQAAIDALDLIEEEHRTLTDGWIQPSRDAAYYAAGLTPPPATTTHETRLVGPWRVDGEGNQ